MFTSLMHMTLQSMFDYSVEALLVFLFPKLFNYLAFQSVFQRHVVLTKLDTFLL
jgi:hypothetical protein